MLLPMHVYVLLQPLQIRIGVADDREYDHFNAGELSLAIRSLAIRNQIVTPHDCIRNEGKVDLICV